MEIYVGNLSPKSTLTGLRRFFKGYARKARMAIVEKPHDDGSKSRYGLVEIEQDKLARKAIQKLDLKELDGRRLILREYVHRAYSNDRRALNWRDKPWDGAERRRKDRRRGTTDQGRDDDFEALLAASETREEVDEPRITIRAFRWWAKKG